MVCGCTDQFNWFTLLIPITTAFIIMTILGEGWMPYSFVLPFVFIGISYGIQFLYYRLQEKQEMKKQ